MIYLIRHTKPNTPFGTCYGHTDVGLDESFPQEMATISKKLRSVYFDLVYSSPLTRCSTLAQNLPRNTLRPIGYDDRLKELNFGKWEMKRWDELQLGDLTQWTSHFLEKRVPDGESFADQCTRAIAFWEEITQNHEGTVAVVCHAGVMRAILTHILKIPHHTVWNLQIPYGQIIKVNKLDNENWLTSFE